MEDKPLRGKDWHRSHNCCSGRCFGEPRGAPKRSRTRSAVAAAIRDRAAHSCAPSTRQTKSPGRSLSGSGRPHRGQFLLICTGHGNNECLSLPKNGGASTGTTNGRGREDRYLPPPPPSESSCWENPPRGEPPRSPRGRMLPGQGARAAVAPSPAAPAGRAALLLFSGEVLNAGVGARGGSRARRRLCPCPAPVPAPSSRRPARGSRCSPPRTRPAPGDPLGASSSPGPCREPKGTAVLRAAGAATAGARRGQGDTEGRGAAVGTRAPSSRPGLARGEAGPDRGAKPPAAGARRAAGIDT